MSDPMPELTEAKRRAEELDEAVMKAARAMNDSPGSPTPPLSDGDIAVSELTYWSPVGALGKVKLALQKNLDVNAADADGYTALHVAAVNDHVEVVRLLLAMGANRTKRAMGETPADLARAYSGVLELLSD